MKNITRVWIGDPFEGGHFNGTAFFIDEHTLITAKHVIVDREGETYENIFLSNMPDGGITPVVSVTLCERDIAILKVKKAFDVKQQNIMFTDKLSIGDSVNVVGFYDNNSSQKHYKNRVSGYQNHDNTYELQNHLTNGLSGSPVLLDGKIAGITKAINSSKNLTYVIPIEEVCVDLDMNQAVGEEKENEEENPLRIDQRIFNEIYSVRIPFIIFLIAFSTLSHFYFKDGFKLEDGISVYIILSYLLSKIVLYIGEVLKRKKDVSK